MRKIKELTELPMGFTDVSSLGASQYRGRHKEDILISLWEMSGRKKNIAENGIIFMDEFDKLLSILKHKCLEITNLNEEDITTQC